MKRSCVSKGFPKKKVDANARAKRDKKLKFQIEVNEDSWQPGFVQPVQPLFKRFKREQLGLKPASLGFQGPLLPNFWEDEPATIPVEIPEQLELEHPPEQLPQDSWQPGFVQPRNVFGSSLGVQGPLLPNFWEAESTIPAEIPVLWFEPVTIPSEIPEQLEPGTIPAEIPEQLALEQPPEQLPQSSSNWSSMPWNMGASELKTPRAAPEVLWDAADPEPVEASIETPSSSAVIILSPAVTTPSTTPSPSSPYTTLPPTFRMLRE